MIYPLPACPLCGCRCAGSPDPTRWLSVREFAEANGMHRASVYRWIRSGLLYTQRIDGVLRVRPEDERSWAASLR